MLVTVFSAALEPVVKTPAVERPVSSQAATWMGARSREAEKQAGNWAATLPALSRERLPEEWLGQIGGVIAPALGPGEAPSRGSCVLLLRRLWGARTQPNCTAFTSPDPT